MLALALALVLALAPELAPALVWDTRALKVRSED